MREQLILRKRNCFRFSFRPEVLRKYALGQFNIGKYWDTDNSGKHPKRTGNMMDKMGGNYMIFVMTVEDVQNNYEIYTSKGTCVRKSNDHNYGTMA